MTSLVDGQDRDGAGCADLYNVYPAVLINGRRRPGYSDGQAIAAMEAAAAKTPAQGLRL